jgi:hypothetical protein
MADDIREIAEVANSLAQNASARSAVSGVLMQALIDVLIENGTLNQNDVERAYKAAHSHLIHAAPPNVLNTQLHAVMLDILRCCASGHNVELEGSA